MNRWYFGTIGTGPAGELRYPSYDSHDSSSGWPNRGFFQAYVRAVNLHFTALEMDNCEDTQTCQIDASQAKALVWGGAGG
jgi:hypothetical protein